MAWIICAILSGLCAAVLITVLSVYDDELPCPGVWQLGIVMALTAGLSARLVFLHGECVWATGLFTVYLALVIYTDARIRKVYTLPNYLMLGGVLLLDLVLSLRAGAWDPVPLVAGGIFLAMGLAGLYGRGDGFVLAVVMIYLGMLWEDAVMAILVTVLAGCLTFVLYSGGDYLWHRWHGGQRIAFWKAPDRSFRAWGSESWSAPAW